METLSHVCVGGLLLLIPLLVVEHEQVVRAVRGYAPAHIREDTRLLRPSVDGIVWSGVTSARVRAQWVRVRIYALAFSLLLGGLVLANGSLWGSASFAVGGWWAVDLGWRLRRLRRLDTRVGSP